MKQLAKVHEDTEDRGRRYTREIIEEKCEKVQPSKQRHRSMENMTGGVCVWQKLLRFKKKI